MASIATLVAVAVIFVVVALLAFRAVARGLPDDKEHEVEVKLLFVTIRRRVSSRGAAGQLPEGARRGAGHRAWRCRGRRE
ncbi:MAG: hypothetical protein WBC33_01285 [Conexibacter sp.]